MRVAILSLTTQASGGWGNITHELCAELAACNEINFTLHMPKGWPVRHDAPYQDRVRFDLPPFVLSFSRRSLRYLPYYYLKRLDLSHVDLIHSIVDFPYGFFAYLQARHYNVPFIISGQGTYLVTPFRRILDRYLFQKACKSATLITVPSNFTMQRFLSVSGVNMEKVRVLHNAVNYQRFQRHVSNIGMCDQFKGKRIILSVGVLRKRKGFDILIRAIASVRKIFPNAELVIIGPGNKESLKLLASELGVAQNVHLVGNKTGDELIAYLHACDVFALTPRQVDGHFEGFGIVYLEASACGKPIVASRSGGVPDVVVDMETGLLVPEGDIEATAEAIITLLQNQDLARKLANQGKLYAARHDWKWYCKEVIGIYREVLRDHWK